MSWTKAKINRFGVLLSATGDDIRIEYDDSGRVTRVGSFATVEYDDQSGQVSKVKSSGDVKIVVV